MLAFDSFCDKTKLNYLCVVGVKHSVYDAVSNTHS